MIRIIGLDPGLRSMGWGVIDSDGVRLCYVASGTIASDKARELSVRLRQLYEGLSATISAWAPQEAAAEETFVNKDARATLKLGQARGVALLASALSGLAVAEYAPNAVKKAIVGAGHADKGQIRAMVRMLLPLARFDGDDEADALAIAICHAHHRQGAALNIVA